MLQRTFLLADSCVPASHSETVAQEKVRVTVAMVTVLVPVAVHTCCRGAHLMCFTCTPVWVAMPSRWPAAVPTSHTLPMSWS